MKMGRKLIALLIAAIMLLSLAAPALAATPSDIGSLPSGTQTDIQQLINAGVVGGYPDGSFKPNAPLTRGDYAKFVVNAAGLDKITPATPSFKDVGSSMANYGYIEAAAAAKLIQGYTDKTYRPTQNITQGQAAVIAVRAMGETTGSYSGDVAKAVELGILASSADSGKQATRGGAAVIIVDTNLVAPVTPPAPKAATVTVSTTAAASVAKGTNVQFTAVVKDSTGKAIDGAAVTWSASKGVIGADGTFAATATGAITITAKSGDASGTASITVYGPATKIQLIAPASLTANGSAKGTVRATAVDADGNVDPTFAGTINFATTAGTFPNALGTTAVKATNGIAETSLTSAAAAGTATVSASATGLTGAVASTTLAAQKLTSIALSADPATIAADGVSTSTITVKLLDQDGKAISTTASVKLTSSNTSAATFGGSADTTVNIAAATSGTANLKATNNIGSTTISGVVTTAGLTTIPVTSVTVNSTVVGVPYKLSIDANISDAKAAGATGTDQAVVVRVLDANGNQVTNPTGAVSITLTADKATATVDNVSPLVNATASKNVVAAAGGKITFYGKDTKAETVTYTATGTIGGFTLQKATASGNFVSGAATNIALTASPDAISANGTSTSTLTAKIVDANGNTVTDGTFAVDFTKDTDNGATAAFTKTTVNTVNGVATVTVTSTTKANVVDTYKAAVSTIGAGVFATDNITTGIYGPAYGLGIANKGTNRIGTAGKDVTINVNVTDGNGTVLTNDNGRAVSLAVKDSKGAVAGTFTANTVNGIAAIKVNLTKTGEYDLEATSTGLVKDADAGPAGATGAITIGAAVASQLKVASDVDTLAADTASQAKITITLLDQYGNTAIAAADTTVKLTPNSQSYGAFQGAGVAADGSITETVLANTSSASTTDGTDSLKATATPGVTTITASSSGLTSATTTITTSVIGAPAKLAVQTVSDATAGANQTVKVNILDANGARVTSSVLNVTITYKRTGDAGDQTQTAAAVKGQATFTVTDTKAETVTYTATSGTLLSSTGTGNFVPDVAAAVTVSIAPSPIVGNGSSVATVTVKVTDGANNNLVSTVNGTASVKITAGSDYAFLPGAAADGTLSVAITNGVGTAIIQAKDLSLADAAKVVTVTGTYKPDATTTWTNTGNVTVNKP